MLRGPVTPDHPDFPWSAHVFPDPCEAEPDGLLVIGGDLQPDTMLSGYAQGIFAWTVNPITWWSPDPRAVFAVDLFHVPRRLERTIRQNRFKITFDRDFAGVVRGCAEPAPGRDDTWITPEFVEAYQRLHRLGWAHSAEAWYDDQLVGGVFGIAIGGFFSGESMFHRMGDATKVALATLMRHLQRQGFVLFDSQVMSPAAERLGAANIPRDVYLHQLRLATRLPRVFLPTL